MHTSEAIEAWPISDAFAWHRFSRRKLPASRLISQKYTRSLTCELVSVFTGLKNLYAINDHLLIEVLKQKHNLCRSRSDLNHIF